MVEKKFLKAIKDFNLVESKDRILVAFSGGIDSTVLTALLLKFQKYLKIEKIALAHLNHSLRGAESDLDEEFCKSFAEEKGLKIYTKKEDVKKYAKEHSMSIEEAARTVRYSFLQEIALREEFNKIATGHHLSDLIETMILWFIQGNKKGIKGFKPYEKNVIRPLFYLTKEEIRQYAEKKDIKYTVDRTNFKTDILRNKIRHDIIPLLRQINPSIEKSMLIESLFLQIDEDFIEKEVEKFSQKFLKDRITLTDIADVPEAVLYRMLTIWIYKKTGIYPSYRKIWEILKILKKSGEKSISLSRDYQLIKSYSQIIIKKKEKSKKYSYKIKTGDEVYIKEAGVIIKSYISKSINMGKLKDERKIVCFDIGEENPEFVIRNRKAGDRFLPFGQKSEKKLKDIMIELKIPKYMRDTIPILEFRNKILWVVGYKRSGHYPVTEQTKKMICFEIKEV
ncbi:tRNA lysidine(34) synthetase TilS [Persephonella atlantica]|uniref:tRNA(Ile)-lysidine synthase n=1 Tax=Persephonella atlantica TaxID=2699429 RepID=A0ABS1GGP9_9AQUI|nr:tRNA lysidine(34) synthetase TilS [Persephonella atlantica]